MVQTISVVRYDVTRNNVTTVVVKNNFSSMTEAQLYIKALANNAYFPILKQTKNTLALNKWTKNTNGIQRMIMFFKIIKSASIPINPKEIEKIKEELFIKES